jgi:TetR/AcrR family transcriptional regulator, repressor of fatR-cypB operon
MEPRPGRRDGDATRERLLHAALDLYTTAGFVRTTTPMLAERAGIAEGTIYRHFSSKEALLNEAWRHAYRAAIELLRALEADRVRKAPERLALLGRQLVDAAAGNPPLLRMLFATEPERFLDEPSRALRRDFLDGLVQLVAMGKSDGLVRPGPAELWASVWLTLVGHAVAVVASGEWSADSSPAALTLEAAWDAIAAKPSPTPSSVLPGRSSGPAPAGEPESTAAT